MHAFDKPFFVFFKELSLFLLLFSFWSVCSCNSIIKHLLTYPRKFYFKTIYLVSPHLIYPILFFPKSLCYNLKGIWLPFSRNRIALVSVLKLLYLIEIKKQILCRLSHLQVFHTILKLFQEKSLS